MGSNTFLVKKKKAKFYYPEVDLNEFSNPPFAPFSVLLILQSIKQFVALNSRYRSTDVTGKSKVAISQSLIDQKQ